MKERTCRITDDKQLEMLANQFWTFYADINSKVYNSFFEERNRTHFFSTSTKFAFPVEIVFPIFISEIIRNLHSELQLADISEGAFYRTSNKNNNVIVRLSEYVPNEIFHIEWISKKQWFERTFAFHTNSKNTKTKVKYAESIKGMITNVGPLANISYKAYLKSQLKGFKLTVLQTKLQLTDDSKKRRQFENAITKIVMCNR